MRVRQSVAFVGSHASMRSVGSDGSDDEVDDGEAMSPLSMLFDGIMADWNSELPSGREEQAYPYSPAPSSEHSRASTCVTTPDHSPHQLLTSLPARKEVIPRGSQGSEGSEGSEEVVVMTMPGGGPLDVDCAFSSFWSPVTPAPSVPAARPESRQTIAEDCVASPTTQPLRPVRPVRPVHCQETLEDLAAFESTPVVSLRSLRKPAAGYYQPCASLRSVRKPPAEYYSSSASPRSVPRPPDEYPATPLKAPVDGAFKLAPAPAARMTGRRGDRASVVSAASFVSARSQISIGVRAPKAERSFPPSASRSRVADAQAQLVHAPALGRKASLLNRLGLRRPPQAKPLQGPTDYSKIPPTSPPHQPLPAPPRPRKLSLRQASAPPPARQLTRKLSFSHATTQLVPSTLSYPATRNVVTPIPALAATTRQAPRHLARKLSFSQPSPLVPTLRRTTSLRSNPPAPPRHARSASRTLIVHAASTHISTAKKVTFALTPSSAHPL